MADLMHESVSRRLAFRSRPMVRGILRDRILDPWISGVAGVAGLAAITLTMLLPDHLAYFVPVFHVFSLWLLLTGVAILGGWVCV